MSLFFVILWKNEGFEYDSIKEYLFIRLINTYCRHGTEKKATGCNSPTAERFFF